MILKQEGKQIESATRRKNLFVLDICQSAIGKIILVKRRERSTYLISKNPQIRFWHRKLGHTSNTRVVETSKLTNDIEILIDNGQCENGDEYLSSDCKSEADKDIESINSENNDNPRRSIATQLNQVTDSNKIEELYDLCIESKYTKIIRHK